MSKHGEITAQLMKSSGTHRLQCQSLNLNILLPISINLHCEKPPLNCAHDCKLTCNWVKWCQRDHKSDRCSELWYVWSEFPHRCLCGKNSEPGGPLLTFHVKSRGFLRGASMSVTEPPKVTLFWCYHVIRQCIKIGFVWTCVSWNLKWNVTHELPEGWRSR